MSREAFNIASTAIENGVTFLEASAGTGKTYAISRMVVRLLAEKRMPISSILVMTFTEAATRELKSRVRQAIQETLHHLDYPNSGDELAARYSKENEASIAQIKRRLKLALATFDEAPIFTIHGFCHRVLNEFAFESNHLFEPTLLKNPEPLWLESLQDFWRTQYYRGDPFIPPVLDSLGQTPSELLNEFRKLARHPGIDILPEVSATSYQHSLAELKRLWSLLGEQLNADRDEMIRLLENDGLFKKPLKNQLPFLCEELGKAWPDQPTLSTLSAIKLLTRDHISGQLYKKAEDTPVNSFFHDICSDWEQALGNFGHQHKFHSLKQVEAALDARKSQDNLLTFDDLLPAVLHTLESSSGDRLQLRLRQTYQATLIDEFQDTDPHQTEFFRRLFITPDHFLCFIGDPKQAIYKFRGADVFSYLQAKAYANHNYTLGTNWRSDPALIEAVNSIFSSHKRPFVFDEIAYTPSKAAIPNGRYNHCGNPVESPFNLCFLPSIDGKPVTNEQAHERIQAALCQEILKLLNGNYEINGKKANPADIAILTRTKIEAEAMRNALADHGLPAVLTSDLTVFETQEATQLRDLLYVLSEPSRMDWLRSLYASNWFGWTAERIYRENQSINGWEEVQEAMRKFHHLWTHTGIAYALDAWIRWSGVKQHLLSQPGGERSVTHLLHLTELLGQVENEFHLTPPALLQWMERNITEPNREREDFVTRLESDSDSIQIATIHKSKGLQYPIVFVPYAWNSVPGKNEECVYHQEANNNTLVYDCRPVKDSAGVLRFQKEALSDAVRLLYVALTRAEHACYLFWGELKSQEWSPVGYIFGVADPGQTHPNITPVEAFNRLKKRKPNGVVFADVERMANRKGPRYAKYKNTGNLQCNPIRRVPERGFSISSFSSLATGFKESIEDTLPEDEEDITIPGNATDIHSIFTLPKGTVTGNLIHDIMEQSDLSCQDSIFSITEQLGKKSSLENHWIPVLQGHLAGLVNIPLFCPEASFQLKDLLPENCLKESEFHFPTRNTSLKALLGFFKRIAERRFGSTLPMESNWEERRLVGYLRGFIDLLFLWNGRYYILDWKSNWLGNSVEDYQQPALEQAMSHHAYYLQYYLYTLATFRYLQFRLPGFDYEKHFGGVYYLFVRGIHQGHGNTGIFFDCPSFDDIRKLDELFPLN